MFSFTKLDQHSAYNLVHIHECNGWKMDFNTTSGHFEFCVIPHGFSCISTVLKWLLNGVLRDMLGNFLTEYIRDILIYSPILEDHVIHVRKVLSSWKSTVCQETCFMSPRFHSLTTYSVLKVFPWVPLKWNQSAAEAFTCLKYCFHCGPHSEAR